MAGEGRRDQREMDKWMSGSTPVAIDPRLHCMAILSHHDNFRGIEGPLPPPLGGPWVPPGVADEAAAPDHQIHGLVGVTKGPGVDPIRMQGKLSYQSRLAKLLIIPIPYQAPH